MFTFGAGMYGQLGHGQIGHEYLPRKIPDLMGSQVTQIACGRCHTLVYIASNKRLYSFGLGGNGQLGIGNCSNQTSPNYVQVELANVKNNLEVKNESKHSQLALFLISAGGDQSFIAYNQSKDNIKPQDFRYTPLSHSILTMNVIENLPFSITDLKTILSSPSCLNASFLHSIDHYNTSNRHPGTDLSKVISAKSLLLNNNDLVLSQLNKLYNELPESPPSIEALRLYITTPFLLQRLDSQMMLFAYAQSINRLKKEAAGRVLDYWFASIGHEYFISLISAYKSVVVNVINMKVVTVESEVVYRHNLLKACMVFLQKLHRVR